MSECVAGIGILRTDSVTQGAVSQELFGFLIAGCVGIGGKLRILLGDQGKDLGVFRIGLFCLECQAQGFRIPEGGVGLLCLTKKVSCGSGVRCCRKELYSKDEEQESGKNSRSNKSAGFFRDHILL